MDESGIYIYGLDQDGEKVHDIPDSKTGKPFFTDYGRARDAGREHVEACEKCDMFKIEDTTTEIRWG